MSRIVLNRSGELQEVSLPIPGEEKWVFVFEDKIIDSPELFEDALIQAYPREDLCGPCLKKGKICLSDFDDANYCTSCADELPNYRIDTWEYDLPAFEYIDGIWEPCGDLTMVFDCDRDEVFTKFGHKWQQMEEFSGDRIDPLANGMVFDRKTKKVKKAQKWHNIQEKSQLTFYENPTMDLLEYCAKLSPYPKYTLDFFQYIVAGEDVTVNIEVTNKKMKYIVGKILDELSHRITYHHEQSYRTTVFFDECPRDDLWNVKIHDEEIEDENEVLDPYKISQLYPALVMNIL